MRFFINLCVGSLVMTTLVALENNQLRASRPNALSFPGSTPQIVGSSDSALLAAIQKCVCEINNNTRINCCSEVGVIDSKIDVLQLTLDIIEFELATLSASSLDHLVATFTTLVVVADGLLSTVDEIASLAEVIKEDFTSISEIIQTVIDIVTDIDSKVDIIESIVELLSDNCAATPITEAGSISAPGVYCLANDVTGNFTIDASNVLFDLNGHTITGGISIGNAVVRNNIIIQNGTLQNSTGDAINITGPSHQEILLTHLIINNASDNGISINGGFCRIVACVTNNNDTGIFVTGGATIIIKECQAAYNTTGFDMDSGTMGSIIGCSAIGNTGTGFNDVDGITSNVNYVTNFATGNGTNYSTVAAPFFAFSSTTAGISYWYNIFGS